MELDVVCHKLVEHLLGYGNGGCLVFDNHLRMELAVVEYAVGSQVFLSDAQFHLVGKQCSRIAEIVNKVMDEVLANPFFRGQCDIPLTQHVENLRMFAAAAQLYFEWREI